MAPSSLFHRLLLPLLLLLASISHLHAQAYHNISLGSSLTPVGQNNSWLSPSGEFAFGFYPLETNSSLFLLAIWFEKTVNRTVVWYANGDQLVQDGAKVELTTDGRLSLKDQNDQEVWSPSISNASYAAILDTGNFVLASADASMLWKSFDHPTDTILPSQELDLGTNLRSRMMDTDYSSGRFELKVQGDGNLVFYPVAVPSGLQYDPYWSSNTVGNGTKLIFDKLGTIYFALKNDTSFNFTSGRMESMGDFYQRATLDPDGVFRQYVQPKKGRRTGSWSECWTLVDFQPQDIWRALTTGTGSGVCGFCNVGRSIWAGSYEPDPFHPGSPEPGFPSVIKRTAAPFSRSLPIAEKTLKPTSFPLFSPPLLLPICRLDVTGGRPSLVRRRRSWGRRSTDGEDSPPEAGRTSREVAGAEGDDGRGSEDQSPIRREGAGNREEDQGSRSVLGN